MPLWIKLSKGVFFMAKRTRTSKIDKWIKEGRGSGIGSDYKPWLYIQDVSSSGRSGRPKGIKTGRQYDFLSDLERYYFYLAEYSDFVVDIREQFPLLPLEETIVIADELGIEHSTNPKNGELNVMTTDFLLTLDKGKGVSEVARTIKMKDELFKERVLEKFEIEREYWQRRNIDWAIVTDEDIPKTLARNLSYVHSPYYIKEYDVFREMNEKHIEELAISLMQRLLNQTNSIRAITNEFEFDTHLPFGSGLTLFYHLIAQKIIQINLLEDLNVEQPIKIQSIDENRLKQVRYG